MKDNERSRPSLKGFGSTKSNSSAQKDENGNEIDPYEYSSDNCAFFPTGNDGAFPDRSDTGKKITDGTSGTKRFDI